MAEKLEPGKIFVGGLSWDTTKESLTAYFSKYGEVSDSVIMLDSSTKEPRGFGFVSFKDHASVKAVVEDSSHFLDRKKIDPKEAINKDHHPSNHSSKSCSIEKKVFIGGLPHGTKVEDLKKYFCKFGAVLDAEIKLDRVTQKPRGFAFVEFVDCECRIKACHDQFQSFNDKKVEVKAAEDRTPGSQQQQIQSSQNISWTPQHSYPQTSPTSYNYSYQQPCYYPSAQYTYPQSQTLNSYQSGPISSSYHPSSQYQSNGTYSNTVYPPGSYNPSNFSYPPSYAYSPNSYPQASQADPTYPGTATQQSTISYHSQHSTPFSSNYPYSSPSGTNSGSRW